jgi:hypothetical protein
MDISFDCDTCGKHLVVDEAGAGITIDCPGCGKPAYVPSLSSHKPPDPPVRVEVKSATPKTAPVAPPKISSSYGNRRAVWTLPPLVTKYGTLRAIANFCQFMAVPVGIVQVLLGIVFFRFGAPFAIYSPIAFIPVVIACVGGVLSVVVLLGTAESIRVFIDIEENTRATRQMMEYELRGKYQPSSPSTGASTTAAPKTDQSPSSASQVRFSGH